MQMQPYDSHAAQDQLILDSDISVSVLGRNGDFVLVSLSDDVDSAIETAAAKGWVYCGVLAVTKDGQAGARCEQDPDCIYTMMHAALAFAQKVADRLRLQVAGDAVHWLESLYRLEDPRPYPRGYDA
jgi:hypothetical protein